MRAEPSLVVVGAASRDLADKDRRGWRLGGGVTYGAMAAARLGLQVRALVGVDETTSSAPELDTLAAAGVELELVRLARAPAMRNVETATGRIQHVEQAGARLPTEALPAGWRHAAAYLLAPVAGELAVGWARALPSEAFVALAWQGLFRRLLAGRTMVHLRLRRTALVARADSALVSADDAAAGGTPLRGLVARDGQQLVVTGGERGALHLARDGRRLRGRYLPALPARAVRDTTGAGDVFLAAWCAALVGGQRAGRDWPALAIAAAAASLSVETSGLLELPSLDEVCDRLRRSPFG